MDLLSGSWPGEIFLFRGGAGRTFAAPVKLRRKDGKCINVTGGVRTEEDGMLLVAGDATFERSGEKLVILYEGERIEVPKGGRAGITGTASAVHACDWDGDRDLDLLVGVIGGGVYLVPNEGDGKTPAFGAERALEAGGEPIGCAGDAGPFAADWDGDGDLDLLLGSGDGSVRLHRNAGKPGEPLLAAGEELLPACDVAWDGSAPAEPRRGIRSKICAADWNGDGRLDLLVGDYTTMRPPPAERGEEETAAIAKARADLDAAAAAKKEIRLKLAMHPPSGKEEVKKLAQRVEELDAEMARLRGTLPDEYEEHGFVWLFLRRPAKDG